MRYICNQKGGVWIQNRGPEQEIPATTKLCLNYWTQLVHKKTTRKLRKSREFLATIFSIPVLFAVQSCEFKALMAGVCALIDKDPLPHSGAQSVSR